MGFYTVKWQWLLILHIVPLCLIMSRSSGITSDGEALLSFRASILDSDGVLLQWKPEEPHPCKWKGITCDPKTKRVIYLSLPYHKLSGSLSPELGKLDHLKILALHDNNFYGTIPSELGNCSQLQGITQTSTSVDPLFSGLRTGLWDLIGERFEREMDGNLEVGLRVEVQSNNETLENNLGETQIETEPVTAAALDAAVVDATVAAAMEKLLQNLQKPPIYPTAHSLLRVVGCPTVKPFRPSASSRAAYKLRTATLNCKSVKSVKIDQPQNKSDIEAGASSMHSKPIELPMYSKNPVTSFPNLPSNYITGSLDSSTGNFFGEKLNGQNYFSWSQSIKMFLEGRHQFGFLTGETVRPPPGDALERLWKGVDSLLRSMLINSMEPQIGKPLLYVAIAKDL
ncbi:LRR receptor-like serine/threonine-protein kinase FEI 2 isoform X1 [Cucumis melo var. makuwa]|uniref:LRR receptor-like serine/threonine-protein kinase FEI 2 isoform X1 n=1 Tax=Cucumis melo var. makuwa TaxID=1194695 RepID=A0A5D3BS79_CUCMM|nr:LRR receptor-like serine/threonine-protein kinase FEI 2 isoform X1 [Cucumis melo var. makuwa]TYK01858.1 LRR receptor-like serine/threonine-protein kinase FEI 2 isoform X1 [Cucumis melo var. makuwa]